MYGGEVDRLEKLNREVDRLEKLKRLISVLTSPNLLLLVRA